MLRSILFRIAVRLGVILEQVSSSVARKTLPRFANNPKDVQIELPRRIANPERIFLGDHVRIGPGALLIAVAQYPGVVMQHPDEPLPVTKFESRIVIGHRVTATASLQIAAHREVVIGDDVMFASNVHIEDGSHGMADGSKPYKYQPIAGIAPVTIKRGCWIGQNVVILPGVTIGENTIVGANSVVKSSLPDRSIAVGSPARVVKRWDESIQSWIRTAD